MRVQPTLWRSAASSALRYRTLSLVAATSLISVLVAAGAGAATRPAVAPGQSWDAACEAAAPGDVIPLGAGTHPPQSISCRKAAPGVTFRPVQGASVVVGSAGRAENCLSLGGSTYVTVEGVRTTTYTAGGKPGQCGVSVGRGSTHHVTLRNVDGGHIFVAANDVQILGGDYGPTADMDGRISDRTCDATSGSCPVTNLLIDGAYFHDHRRVSDHMQCISYDSGVNSTIRNSRFYNCAVFSIFVSGGSAERFSGLTFENNVYERGSEAMSNHVKFSDHGAAYKSVAMRNDRFVGDDLLVASRSASDYRFQAITGAINVSGACSNCRPGTYRVGSTVATIEGTAGPAPQCSDGINNDPAEDLLIDTADPGCSSPSDDSELGNPAAGNSAPVACFTRTPNPSNAGQTVTFDGSCSTDSDGDALTYAWDVAPAGDGVYERSGRTTTYAYGSAGTKKARLRVDDGHGHVVIAEQSFTVG
jgi:PKD domain